MKNNNLKQLFKLIYKDKFILSMIIIIFVFSFIISLYLSITIGILIQSTFVFGCITAIVLLNHKNNVCILFDRISHLFGFKEMTENIKENCDICGTKKCKRHFKITTRESWKGLFIDKELDAAVDSFYTRILTSFVESWFSLLSKDDDFVKALKENLREATCRLIHKIKDLNAPVIITNKLLPCVFSHYELIEKMLNDGVPMQRLATTFTLNEYAIHPACINRQAELDYLRALAKCLIPRLCNNEYFNSKVFFSLARELLACWVFLPLMDVISDPNLINLLIIVATNRTKNPKFSRTMSSSSTGTTGSGNIGSITTTATVKDKVIFLENFVKKKCENNKANLLPSNNNNNNINKSTENDNLLTDQNQLYSFMQFLKKEGAVDLLRFYLDVDNLNMELLDPKITTDPAKLSSLYQQSERLLKSYQQMMSIEYKTPVKTLAEAHSDVKRLLEGKWKKAFHSTPEYFHLIYGGRNIQEHNDFRSNEHQSGPVSRLGSKLKGAIRGAIDGAPIEAIEVPTVWDTFTDEPNITTAGGNTTIYNSVTQKLRKERGQNLDNFIVTFMQSIEQCTDIGEDVMSMKNSNRNKLNQQQQQKQLLHNQRNKPTAPGRNLVFGDLFEIRHFTSQFSNRFIAQHSVKGPSKCLIYILVKIFKTNLIIIRLILGFINVSEKTVDSLICKLIDQLIRIGLYEPRLAILITTLEEHLFGPKEAEPSSTELLERQRQAKLRLNNIYNGLGSVIDVFQSPPLNKHLMYCLFDIILTEMYPDLDTNSTINNSYNNNDNKNAKE